MTHCAKSIKVVFILGTGHCGSTLLDMLLGAHPKIEGLGEVLNIFRGMSCTCGKKDYKCSFWVEASNTLSLKHFDIFRKKIDFLIDRKQFLRKTDRMPVDYMVYIRENEQLFTNVLNASGAEILVDSSKSTARVALLSSSEIIEPVLIHLVRDGRAVTWSYMKKYGHPLRCMMNWMLYNIKASILIRRYSSLEHIFIRYEDLATHPDIVLRELMKKLNLPYNEDMLDFRNSEQHQIGGNRMKFRSEGIQLDRAWKRDMPIFYRLMFQVTCGWLNALYYRSTKAERV